jgi:MGT family glycosyltransferase
MSKCIFFCVPAHGHVNAQLALVDALVKKGEKVIYYCAPAFREKIEKTGAEFRPFATSADSMVTDMGEIVGFNAIKIARMVMDVSNEVIGIASRIVREEKPAYVVSDVITYFGMAAAEANKVPLITFFPVFCSTPLIADCVPFSFILRILWQALTAPIDMIAFIAGAAKLKKHFAGNPIGIFNPFSRASSLNLISISRQFQFKEKLFPDGKYVFTGPMLFYGREKADFPVEKFAGKKVIYISLGTVYHRNPQFFEECIKAFGDTDYAVIMSMFDGPEKMLKTDTGLPGNFIVQKYVPQLQVLKYTDVFITHAGMNSVQEAMYFGVPIIAVPQSTDQYLNGSRAAQIGAGIYFDRGTVKASVLRRAVEKVLANPAYKEKAKLQGDEARKAGGVETAMKAIEGFKQRNSIL